MKKIVKTPIITRENNMSLSLPITVHIELTSSCCFRCKHCYNFWRQQKSQAEFMSDEQLDTILNELIENKIMHVIFTGGEPFLNNKVLLRGIKKLKEAGASVTCNSTLAIMNSAKELKILREAGLEHILTSLNSYRPEINDNLVSIPGAYNKILEGIKNAVAVGIRISVNMIISESNIKDVYPTAELVHKLGGKKFFGTRVVPHISKSIDQQKEFLISRNEALYILDELIKVEHDFGLQVGTLIPFPYCLMDKKGHLRRYANFYSHGCPAGNKMISLNTNGNAHACVHESKSYGNIFEIGIKGVWERMKEWRSGEIFPEPCKNCPVFDECNGGCRLCALAHKGKIYAEDNLRVGWDKAKEINFNDEYVNLQLNGLKCSVSGGLRFRKENGFYVVDRFGSEILCVKNEIADILKNYCKEGIIFSPQEVGLNEIEVIKSLLRQKLLSIEKI